MTTRRRWNFIILSWHIVQTLLIDIFLNKILVTLRLLVIAATHDSSRSNGRKILLAFFLLNCRLLWGQRWVETRARRITGTRRRGAAAPLERALDCG